MRHLDEREPVADLDRADRATRDSRLVGDRPDDVRRPQPDLAPATDEQPRHPRAVAEATSPPPAGDPGRRADLRPQGQVGQLHLLAVGATGRLIGQARGGQRDVHQVELLRERLDHGTVSVEVVTQQHLAQRRVQQLQPARTQIGDGR